MAVFVDTGIFVAARNRSDTNHTVAKQLLRRALRAEFGRVVTSDYVVDEAVTVALARTHNHQIAVNTGRLIIDSPRIEKLAAGEERFFKAWGKFKDMNDKALSFTDCLSLVIMEEIGASKILSFDSGFDGLVARIH